MKVIVFLSLFTSQLFAVEYSAQTISKKEQLSIIKNIAISLESEAFQSGHDYIDSEFEEFSSERLSEFLKKEHLYMEDKLLSSDIEKITFCIENIRCSVYKMEVSSEYYSGYGFDYYFIFLDRTSGSYTIKKYAGYNE